MFPDEVEAPSEGVPEFPAPWEAIGCGEPFINQIKRLRAVEAACGCPSGRELPAMGVRPTLSPRRGAR